MIINANEPGAVACPHRADAEARTLRCLGSKCAAFRWVSWNGPFGYCGLSGPVNGPARRLSDGSAMPSTSTLLDADLAEF